MYETGSGQKPYLPMGEVNHPEENRTRLQPFPAHVSNITGASTVHSVQPDSYIPSSEPAYPHISALPIVYKSRPCVCCINMLADACDIPTST